MDDNCPRCHRTWTFCNCVWESGSPVIMEWEGRVRTQDPITIVTVWTLDKFGPEYMRSWKKLTQAKWPDQELAVITDKPKEVAGMGLRPIDAKPFTDYTDQSGWWPTLMPFMPDFMDESFLLSGIDGLWWNDPTPLLEKCEDKIILQQDWGYGMSHSFGFFADGIMYYPAGCALRDEIWKGIEFRRHRLRGIQYPELLLNQILGEHARDNNDDAGVDVWDLGVVCSYKGGMLGHKCIYDPGHMDRSLVIAFHGEPKPHEVVQRKMPGWEQLARDWWVGDE